MNKTEKQILNDMKKQLNEQVEQKENDFDSNYYF